MASANSPSVLISTTHELEEFISTIADSDTLYLDLEGKSLGRNGSICIVSILVHPKHIVRLIDITTLGKDAFTTAGSNGKTLKSILEDDNIMKCIWDCRNDADALYSLYQVSLAGVTDIQLFENATRTGAKTYLCGLAKAIEWDLQLNWSDRRRWQDTKKAVTGLMSSDIFAARPMERNTIDYCVNDLVHLPLLLNVYTARLEVLSSNWTVRVRDATARRIQDARSEGYEPHSEQKRFGPWGI
ncbi:hypothetical protein FKW77_002119 [Venturia effusa]|uniref:3'-5' exonuclease domain-containing protein n=1 Tax=Venturia effusa TaxID=50376 RepID=A0A517LKZ6_9PEZI|nr:hypothetical protein FKW77_002119 [Venturia effusa]